MPIVIPSQNGQPVVRIFESLQELEQETGQSGYHGLFDANTNTILATADSVAHEIGHYLDFKSGLLKNVTEISDPTKKKEASLRNEIVAILFAYTKCGEGGTCLTYEARFLEWLAFTRKSKEFGPSAEKNLSELTFKEIQELATWLVSSEHSWFERLEFFFKGYLTDERSFVTYGERSTRLRTMKR